MFDLGKLESDWVTGIKNNYNNNTEIANLLPDGLVQYQPYTDIS